MQMNRVESRAAIYLPRRDPKQHNSGASAKGQPNNSTHYNFQSDFSIQILSPNSDLSTFVLHDDFKRCGVRSQGSPSAVVNQQFLAGELISFFLVISKSSPYSPYPTPWQSETILLVGILSSKRAPPSSEGNKCPLHRYNAA